MSRRSGLQVVLRLRELAEQGAQARLAEVLSARDVAAASAGRLRHRAVAEAARLARLQAEVGVDAEDLRNGRAWVEQAERQAASGRERLVVAESAVDDARRALADATRAREVVERLLKRLEAAERLAAERREISELAEIGSVRHVWKSLEEAAA